MTRVTFTNGNPAREYDTIQAAAAALLREWPDGVIYDAGGFSHTADDADGTYDVRSGRVALMWANEEASTNDDGSHAVVEIATVEEEWGESDEIEQREFEQEMREQDQEEEIG